MLRYPHITRQKGVALITALLVVSLATILAVALVEHLHYDTRRTGNIMRIDQAQLYNNNAVEFTMSLLRLDRKDNNDYDSLDEYSDDNEQVFPITGGEVSAKVIDQQGCFNLNNLSKSNSNHSRERARYINLLTNLEVDTNIRNTLVDSLIDWLDKDDISEINGAEFDYYIGLEKPYRTANTSMVSPSELRLVKGYDSKIIELIEDAVCVLPTTNSAININTASAEMLESIEGLKGHGERIIKDRDGDPKNKDDDAPFAKINDFTEYVKNKLKIEKFDKAGIQTHSEYFLLESNTRLDTSNVKMYTLIQRNQSDGTTTVVYQSRGTL